MAKKPICLCRDGNAEAAAGFYLRKAEDAVERTVVEKSETILLSGGKA
jgi:hypothetical protein